MKKKKVAKTKTKTKTSTSTELTKWRDIAKGWRVKTVDKNNKPKSIDQLKRDIKRKKIVFGIAFGLGSATALGAAVGTGYIIGRKKR